MFLIVVVIAVFWNMNGMKKFASSQGNGGCYIKVDKYISSSGD